MKTWIKVWLIGAFLLASLAIVTAIEARSPLFWFPEQERNAQYWRAKRENAYWSRVWTITLVFWVAGGATGYVLKR
ncbi:MAG TPA: hypothetical protein VFM35_08020 [Candidatus Binatia bacterium]|nr:hypothetical protein [Candidatus Binatia bacterium]